MSIFKSFQKHTKEGQQKPQAQKIQESSREEEKKERHELRHESMIIRPHLSEQAHRLAEQNQYVFWVKRGANKPLVREEIESRYGVKVTGVNIVQQRGKQKYFKGIAGRRSVLKKAIVSVKQGQKIEIT